MPEGFWEQFRRAPLMELDIPFDARMEYLVGTYGGYPSGLLQEAFLRLEKRLGGQHCKAAVEALQEGDMATAAAIALRYYDKTYAHANSRCAFHPILQVKADTPADPSAAWALIQQADEHGL